MSHRFRRLIASGSRAALFTLPTANPVFDAARRVRTDSTGVRAHRHAAGARREEKRAGPGGRRGRKRWAAAGAV